LLSDNYTITVTDDNGCTASETINFTVVERTEIDPVASIVGCGEIDIDSLPAITGTNLSGNEAYYDDTQANGGQIVSGNIASSGNYYIYDTGGNCSNEVLVDITINEIPQITSSLEDTAYCDYEVPGDITFTVSGQPDWTIEYTLDGTNQTVTSSQNTINLGNDAGLYNITLIEDDLCSDTIDIEFELIIKPTPPSPTVFEDAEYCASDELDSMRAEGTGGILSWYRNNLQQFLGVGEQTIPQNNIGSTTYYITETVNGCESQPSEINIDIIDCKFILSTAITPDNDGLNDTWELPRLDDIYPNNVVQVYNRWGSLIFEHDSSTQGPYNDNPWDGTINGESLPVGSYFFVIDHNDDSGETTSGAISIILD
jgi:gliding motility-associated-like protein